MRIKCIVNGTVGGTTDKCTDAEIDHINGYRDTFNQFIDKFLLFPKNSAWTISCIKHTGAYLDQYYDGDDYKVPQLTGTTMKEAIEDFVLRNKRVVTIDEVDYPDNEPCAR